MLMTKRDRKKRLEKTVVDPLLVELRAQRRERAELERKELARLVERLFDNVRIVRARLGELTDGRRIDANALELLRAANATLAEVYRRLS